MQLVWVHSGSSIRAFQGLIQKIMVGGAKQAELDYGGGLDAQYTQSCALFLGGLGACLQENF